MSDRSSLLVEKLWRLKRLIDKGECPGVSFVHLNNLLREPGYRSDVLRRVEGAGSEKLKRLAEEIRAEDTGAPLMATATTSTAQITPPRVNDARSLLVPPQSGLDGSRRCRRCYRHRRVHRF